MEINKIQNLKDRVQRLINYYTDKKSFAVDIHKGLYKKLDNLREMEQVEKMPAYILNAYLIYKRAWYSNWQEKHLNINNFDKEGYLEKMETEVALLEKDDLGGFLLELDKRIGGGEIDWKELIKIIQNKYGNK